MCGGFLLCGLLLGAGVWAQEVVVEGQAPIRNGDMGQARDLALQRALGLAAASGSARISSVAQSQPGSMQDSVRVAASACTKGSRIVGESVSGGQLTLNVAVTLDPAPDCVPQCQAGYTNKVAVTGIALEFPQQLGHKETSTLAYVTAVELARKLKQQNRLLVDHAETVFPYSSPDRAPEPFLLPGDKETRFVTLAKARRAQYVVSGVYRDFGIRQETFGAKRTMAIDIFVHDGANGGLLAQRRFSRTASGNVLLRDTPAIGSDVFYATDLGRVWGELLNEVAVWTSNTTACLPFIARVLKVEGRQIFLDMGAEYGVAVGNSLRTHRWKEPPVTTQAGVLLGQEKTLGVNLVLMSVYPGFSIAEVAEAGFDALKAKSGDLLYLQ
jgi:hypothetical protein